MDREATTAERDTLIRSGNFSAAQEVEKTYLSQHPDDAEFFRKAAWTLTALRDFDQALAMQKRAIELAPERAEFRQVLSKIYLSLGRMDEARAAADVADKVAEDERLRYVTFQAQSKAGQITSTRRLLSIATTAWRHSVSDFPGLLFPSIFEHPCDDVPNWSRQQAILALEGEIVSIEHIGSFRVGDHLQVIHKRLARGMPWELPIVGLLMELAARMDPDALTVDVGANVGTVTIPVAAVSTGKVLAFEPEPTNYADLCGNLNLNELSNVTARQEACSDHAGKGEMKRVLSNNPGMAQLSERESGPISVVTLDAAIDGRPVGLLKMDVEGHERKVLAGAAKTIETSRPLIVCEVLKDNAAELQAAFANLGYAGERIFRSDWLFVPRR